MEDCAENNDKAGEDADQGPKEERAECHNSRPAEGSNAVSPSGSVQSSTAAICGENGHALTDVEGEAYQQAIVLAAAVVHGEQVTDGDKQSETATANDVEVDHHDDESTKQSTKEVDKTTATTKPTKSDQTSMKTGNNRTKNTSNKKVWKPGGSLNATSVQHNNKEIVVAPPNRGKQNRQGNVPMRLPPISVPAVGGNDRRKQQTAEAAGRASNGFTTGRAAGLYASPGRVYKCSATACVTVLSQPQVTIEQVDAHDDEPSSGSADFSNRNRKYGDHMRQSSAVDSHRRRL